MIYDPATPLLVPFDHQAATFDLSPFIRAKIAEMQKLVDRQAEAWFREELIKLGWTPPPENEL